MIPRAAVADDTPGTPTIHIVRFDEKIRINGVLDESVWEKIPPITSFVQTEPDEGKPVSEPTEVRIFYDENNLYFGFKCFDNEPQKIIKRVDIHDAVTTSDSVDLLLDPFYDRKSGYFFSINSMGVQFDATVREENGARGFGMFDPEWNAVWRDATSFDSKGWYAEIAIPFSILRFPRTSPQQWGININRWITRKNENSRWVFVPRFDSVMRPSKAGTLIGLQDIEPGHALDFIPSLTARASSFSPQGTGNYNSKNNVALDANYGITSNLTVNATVNPDFLQAEADELNLSLSRFELFFPEKRTFFTDGRDNYQTPLNLFFSRRVGAPLPDGDPQRILIGSKITGKIADYRIGFLEAVTKETGFIDPEQFGSSLTAPGANFLVLRVSRDILDASSIGFVTVNRDQTNTPRSSSQHVAGFDAGFLIGDHITWASQFAISSNPEEQAPWTKQIGLLSDFQYNADTWEYGLTFKSLGDAFDVSQIGFEPETGRFGGNAFFTYKPYVNRYGIRQLYISPNYDFTHLQDGRIDDSGADFGIGAQFKNFWESEIGYSYDRVRYNVFTVDHQPALDDSTQVYVNPKIFFILASNTSRSVWFRLQLSNRFRFVNFPFFFQGRTRNWVLETSFKLGQKLRTGVIANLFQERFLDGSGFQNRGDIIWRVSGNLSRKWHARVLMQYSSQIDPARFRWEPKVPDYSDAYTVKRFAVNSLVAYDFNARSALYVGYNSDRFSPEDPVQEGKEFYAKLSYLFSY